MNDLVRLSPFNGLPVTSDLASADPFKIILAAMVALSYIMWVVAQTLIIWRGYKLKTFGMPALGLISTVSLCFLTGFVGPWVAKDLFYSKEHWYLVWTWRLWWLQGVIIFVQFIRYGKYQLSTALQPYFYMFVLVSVLVAGVTQWTFIIFFKDYYVNIACPLLCVLPMSFGYLMAPFTRSNLKGLSISAAWLLTIGTALLYLSVVLNDMSQPYPGHQSTGYGFIYWIYGLTIFLYYVATVMLVHKTEALEALPGVLPPGTRTLQLPGGATELVVQNPLAKQAAGEG